MKHIDRTPAYRWLGVASLVIAVVICTLLYQQFRGGFTRGAAITAISGRAGLALDEGAKVTLNGVPIGRITHISAITDGHGEASVEMSLEVKPRYLELIPANIEARISAGTVFGNKTLTLSSPARPVSQRLPSGAVITVTSVTTEFNTMFEQALALSENVDPVMLNRTLSATAQALTGTGARLGGSLLDADIVLSQMTTHMPALRHDIRAAAALADTYVAASSDLLDVADHGATTAASIRIQRHDLDHTLLAAAGFGDRGADITQRAGPYLVASARDARVTSALLDRHSPALLCTIRNFHDLEPKATEITGGNGYSITVLNELLGDANPYVYPDNLPRTNARGGPGGRPGCWAPITRELWPAPYLVMDTGASIAPYNHLEVGQPMITDYVWGRQIGQNTINP
jgi:phospholipid/cholesterol/gamma-HCH transport system substrate-binding protein